MASRIPRNQRKRLSLRSVLIVPFVVLLLVLVGIISYLSFRNGVLTVDDLITQLQGEITGRVEERLESYLTTARVTNQNTLDAIRLGLIDVAETESLAQYFQQEVESFPSINTIQFGSEQGEYVGAGRAVDGRVVLKLANPATGGDFHTYDVNDRGEATELLQSRPDYDPRVRPWYVKPVAIRAPEWSDIYLMFSHAALGITIAHPVYETDGQLVGVVGTDILLSELSEFLRGVRIGTNGQAFIMEPSGLLVATSADDPVFSLNDEQEPERLDATRSGNLLTRSVARFLLDRYGDFAAISEPRQLKIEINGQPHVVQIRPVREQGLDWLIVVASPQADFMGRINANTRTTMWLSLLALLGVVTVGLVTARWISRPIMELNSAAKRITEGEWDQELPTHPVTEVDELADSFGAMTENLQETFATVQASEYRFRTLFENSRDMIFITDPEGKVLEINSAGLALFGYRQAEIPQLNAQRWYVNPQDRPWVLEQIKQAGSVQDLEIQFRKQNGTVMDCLLTANERRAEDGRFLGYQGIIRDVTQQKRAEAERLQLAAIQRELLIAQKMQHGLLPPPRPDWPGLEVICTSAPARDVGGDFYSYNAPVEGGGQGYGVAIGDVSGKGMSAALLMGTCLAQFDASAALGLSPGERMVHLDLAVKPYTKTRGQNCAMCYSEISPPTVEKPGSVTIVNAGCVPPYIKRQDGTVEWHEVTGFALGTGLGAEHGYMTKTVPLEPGDLIVLASDGVVEAMDERGHLLGFERLEAILRQAPVTSAEAVQFHLMEAVVDFVGERERTDDMTIVVVRA